MSFINLFTTLFAIFFIKALLLTNVNSAVPSSISPLKHALIPRDLPPCPQRWPDHPYPSDQQRLHDLAVDEKATKGPGWRPSACDKKMWNCVFVERGLETKAGGFYKSAEYPLQHKNRVEVYQYWQSTIQWVDPNGGGAVNSYMAHGVDYVCVTGTMGVKFLGNTSMLLGDPKNPNRLVCDCHYPLDDDKFVFNRKI
ncbi:secreted protein [Melampsora americana]|nr:secreted protein [Melampsora americana]